MKQENLEIEVKYYVNDLAPLRKILASLGAKLTDERILERNWRFDSPDGTLTQRGEVLRIREDRRIRLTYKRPVQGTLERVEIEIEVNDGSKTAMFLKALGYHAFFIYEKFRETYRLGDAEVVLDELPYGSFVEIEGPSIDSIRKVSDQLHFQWDLRVPSTYLTIFEHLKEDLRLPFSDATFDAFAQVDIVLPEDLGLKNGFQADPSVEGSS
jgi:adenylate cyclase class 2